MKHTNPERHSTRLVRSRLVNVCLLFVLIGMTLVLLSVLLSSTSGEQGVRTTAWVGFLSEVTKEIGFVFLPLALVALTWEFYLRNDRISEAREHLNVAIAHHFDVIGDLNHLGILRVYPSRPTERIIQHIRAAQRLRVLCNWFPDYQVFRQALAECLAHGGSLEVYLQAPDSPFVMQRGIDLGYNDDYGRARVLRSLEELEHDSVGISCDRVRVHLIRSMLSTLVVQCDNIAFVSIFAHGREAAVSPQWEVAMTTGVALSGAGAWLEREFGVLKGISVDYETGSTTTTEPSGAIDVSGSNAVPTVEKEADPNV